MQGPQFKFGSLLFVEVLEVQHGVLNYDQGFVCFLGGDDFGFQTLLIDRYVTYNSSKF